MHFWKSKGKKYDITCNHMLNKHEEFLLEYKYKGNVMAIKSNQIRQQPMPPVLFWWMGNIALKVIPGFEHI